MCYFPPRLEVFVADEIRPGAVINSCPIPADVAATLPGRLRDFDMNTHIFTQLQLREGTRTVVTYHKVALLEDLALTPDGARGVERGGAQDSKGQLLENRRDNIDDIIHYLGFTKADDWYAAGPGSLATLLSRIEDITKEHPSMVRMFQLFVFED